MYFFYIDLIDFMILEEFPSYFFNIFDLFLAKTKELYVVIWKDEVKLFNHLSNFGHISKVDSYTLTFLVDKREDFLNDLYANNSVEDFDQLIKYFQITLILDSGENLEFAHNGREIYLSSISGDEYLKLKSMLEPYKDYLSIDCGRM